MLTSKSIDVPDFSRMRPEGVVVGSHSGSMTLMTVQRACAPEPMRTVIRPPSETDDQMNSMRVLPLLSVNSGTGTSLAPLAMAVGELAN